MPMDMAMKYVNHRGETISLGDGGSLHYFTNTIRDWSWTANEVNGGVSSFSRKITTKKLPIGIAAENEEEGLMLRDQIFEVVEKDVLAKELGKLYVGEWYLELFVTSCTYNNYHFDERFAEMSLGCIVPYPAWIKEEENHFYIETETLALSEFLDYPYDFPYDYKRPRLSKELENNSLAPCGMLLRIYGPAQNPYITIAGNTYQVNVSVPEGSRLEIDTRKNHRTITMTDVYGNSFNCFNNRNKGVMGSGEYIWQQIPVGTSALSWDSSFAFDVVKFYERSTHPWSQ